ncbi:MAG: diguanylate cyclase, partial [Candidatus Omnitrophota bacterium]
KRVKRVKKGPKKKGLKKRITNNKAGKSTVSTEMSQNLCMAILDNLYDGVYLIDKDRKIAYWNKSAEDLTGYKASEVIGKICSDGVLMHLNKEGKKLCLTELCPASRVMAKGDLCEEELYLHHKDGHRVYVSTRMTPTIGPQGKITGAIEIFSDNSEAVRERRRNARLRDLAMLDPLTELANRRYGEISLRSRLHELKRYNWPFGILFIDIDHFKNINDTYNHEIGDRVLKMVSGTLSKNARPFDVFCRWGGEEFLGIIANIKDADLFLVAERFRRLIEQSSFTVDGDVINVTVSIGATTGQAYDNSESILKRADMLMYHSKSAGSNRISME